MIKSRDELQNLLDTLEKRMPSLIKANPRDVDFWSMFSEASDFIVEDAGHLHCTWVLIKLDRILQKHGKVLLDDHVLMASHG